MTDKQISSKLGVSMSTISTHWVRMRSKLDAMSRGQVIAKAMSSMYKDAEKELRKSNELYKIIVDTLSDLAVFMLAHDRTLLSWNPGVEFNLGYTQEEFVGKSADMIFNPEDRKIHAAQQEQATAEEHGRASDERWHQRKDGSLFWSLGVMIPLRDDTNKTICYCKILRDNTRHKIMEEALKQVGFDLSSLQTDGMMRSKA